MSIVSIERCPDYGIANVRQAVRQSLENIGGMQAFVKPGERVLLKPNLLMRRKPEKATTTHPAVVQALAELVLEAGGRPLIFDSPGGVALHAESSLDAVYETCGMKDAAGICGAELVFDFQPVDAAFPQGHVIKSLKTVRAVLEADKIINIAKLKTHMMMTYSGAVKNLFGIVPGGYKMEYHFRFEQEDDFAGVIVDICEFAKPALSIIDAVVGMEGNGPTNGKPREIGLIFAGINPYELDIVASSSIGIEPRKVPTIKAAIARKLCSGSVEDIAIAGESLQAVRIKNFKKPQNRAATNIWSLILPKFLAKRLNRALKFKPGFCYDKCRGCGVCAKSCPAAAIALHSGKPELDPSRCISCFCCHELCSFDAVEIHKPWIMKSLFR